MDNLLLYLYVYLCIICYFEKPNRMPRITYLSKTVRYLKCPSTLSSLKVPEG